MGCGASKSAKVPQPEPAGLTKPVDGFGAAATYAVDDEKAGTVDDMTKAELEHSASDTESAQLAKCMGNLEYLRRELLTNVTEERKAEIAKEMRSRKDKCKELRAKGVVPEPGVCVFNQIDVNKTRVLDKRTLERLVKALLAAYKGQEIESADDILKVLDVNKSEDVDLTEWCNNVKNLPLLYATLEKDLDPDWGTLRSYRTLEDQLAKLMGNLERLRRELNVAETDEKKAAITKEIGQRKEACKKLQAKGVQPSPGYVVFAQIDIAKTRKLSTKQLGRLVNALTSVYKDQELESVDKIMAVMDADRSGDIDEAEWVSNLKKLPLLHAALKKDIDPDWGCLKSYRTYEDQLAKCMGNLERLRRELLTDVTPERKAEIEKDMKNRKEECKKFKANGIIPSPAYVVFNQIDVGKARKLTTTELQRLLKALTQVYKTDELESVDKMMKVMDSDRSGDIDEAEWVANLKKLPLLHAALTKDVDPDWGTLRSYRTLEEQLAKLFGNIMRLEAKVAAGDDSVKEELESRKAQAAKMREKGVVPYPGICVFAQVDTDKSRTLSKDELAAAVTKIAPEGSVVDDWFAKLDPEGKGEFDENTWLLNVKKVPDLVAALTADIDPDTGRLKSLVG